jgi:hypothetical protein
MNEHEDSHPQLYKLWRWFGDFPGHGALRLRVLRDPADCGAKGWYRRPQASDRCDTLSSNRGFKTAAELALKRMGEELAALHSSYRARQGQGSVAKNNAITSAVVGTVLIGLVALCAVSNTVGEVGSLIVVGLAIGSCVMIVKRTCRPIEEQLQNDLAAIGAKARNLERRIAEKRAIADS